MFKLLEIEFIDHPFLKDLKVTFHGKDEENSKNYKTLLIGPNGTGKSQVLLAIITIFNSLADLKKIPFKAYSFNYSYKCKYNIDGNIISLSNVNSQLLINDIPYSYSLENLRLPNKLLISSYSFNDKYPLRQNRGKIINKDYYYLGLKSTTNNIFIYNPPKEAIDNLSRAIIAQRDVAKLAEAFKILDLEPELKVVYKVGKHYKFLQEYNFSESSSISPDEFKSLFTRYVEQKKRKRSDDVAETKNFGDEKIGKTLDIDEELTDKIDLERRNLQALISYLQNNIELVNNITNRELNYKPTIKFNNTDTIADFTDHITPFQVLRDLGIISFERFEINKLDSGYAFDNASSGEYHIIMTFLNLLSTIEDNSLVLLDEPEISLHPNWQIRYMDIFDKIFAQYHNTHFIIATHSHFMVSDLKSETSFIAALYADEKLSKIRCRPINKSTYGWAAEEILYTVFNVRTVRNYYLEQDLTRLLGLIGQDAKDRKPEINELIQRIEKVTINQDDPLVEIIDEAKAYLND